jgi:hypothetical protein
LHTVIEICINVLPEVVKDQYHKPWDQTFKSGFRETNFSSGFIITGPGTLDGFSLFFYIILALSATKVSLHMINFSISIDPMYFRNKNNCHLSIISTTINTAVFFFKKTLFCNFLLSPHQNNNPFFYCILRLSSLNKKDGQYNISPRSIEKDEIHFYQNDFILLYFIHL